MKGSVSESSGVSRDWSFAGEPFWLFSHLFAASVIGLFLFFGLGWQLSRHGERVDQNEVIEARAFGEPTDVDALPPAEPDELDFLAVRATGRWADDELIRVANRSQHGRAGDWLVGLFETEGGQSYLVNRGFITRDATPEPAPAGPSIDGWLRETRTRGLFGATDTGVGERVPRLEVEAIAARFDVELAPMWIQLESPAPTGFPEPVPLPSLDNGPHLSYAVQWVIFATLGAIVYGLLLRKRAGEQPARVQQEFDVH